LKIPILVDKGDMELMTDKQLKAYINKVGNWLDEHQYELSNNVWAKMNRNVWEAVEEKRSRK